MKKLTVTLVSVVLLTAPVAGLAAETAPAKPKAKPYPLDTCIVSGEKLGGDMGKPYVFDYKGQEIKMCCPSCKKDFDKDPAKYLKKMADEVAKAKAKKPAAK